LIFLKELFNMARSSLQQQEKDEFVRSCVNLSVQLTGGSHQSSLPGSTDSENPTHADPPNDVNLLFLIGAMLSDPGADIHEKSSALEILSVITMHDPAIVRRHCLDSSKVRSVEKLPILRPEPDELRQLIFLCPPDDLLQSLLLLMSTESEAGLLLQTSEIIRIILDTETMNDQCSLDGNGFMNDENDLSARNGINGQNWYSSQENGSGGLERSEQDTFLSMFYERYVAWLFSPFLYKILVPKVGFPLDSSLKTMVQIQQSFRQRSSAFNIALRFIPSCAIRSSFTLEILSFCVRAHVYRMKLYVLRTRLLSTTLKILSQKPSIPSPSDDKCLKLASLK
jgi:protein phosphatase-4 regulatory subunit 3